MFLVLSLVVRFSQYLFHYRFIFYLCRTLLTNIRFFIFFTLFMLYYTSLSLTHVSEYARRINTLFEHYLS
jgi:hypothetical protein